MSGERLIASVPTQKLFDAILLPGCVNHHPAQKMSVLETLYGSGRDYPFWNFPSHEDLSQVYLMVISSTVATHSDEVNPMTPRYCVEKNKSGHVIMHEYEPLKLEQIRKINRRGQVYPLSEKIILNSAKRQLEVTHAAVNIDKWAATIEGYYFSPDYDLAILVEVKTRDFLQTAANHPISYSYMTSANLAKSQMFDSASSAIVNYLTTRDRYLAKVAHRTRNLHKLWIPTGSELN